MIIYRFEKNGVGPFMNGDAVFPHTGYISKHRIKKTNHLRKITPFDYDKYYEAHKRGKMLFGCSSKDLLRAYFGFKFKGLFKAGYRIKTYNIPDQDVLDIGWEVAFPKKYQKIRKSLTRKMVVV